MFAATAIEVPMRSSANLFVLFAAFALGAPAARAETVSEFLKHCDPPAERSSCYGQIDSATDTLTIREDKLFCPPDFAKLSEAQIMANWSIITKWVRKRPGNEDIDQALAEAWRARYPCKK